MERYTRIRHDFGYREDFVRHCLRACGIDIADVDLVAINRWGHPTQPCEIPDASGKRHIEFEAGIVGRRLPGLSVNHHLAHVASAYFTSPFVSATALTFDGGGDEGNFSIARCADGRIEEYEPAQVENIASWWCALPFGNYRMKPMHSADPGSAAGKLMALAAYGRHEPDIYERLGLDAHEQHHRGGPFAFNGGEDLSDTRSARSQALAHALQHRTERQVANYFAAAHRRHPSENLCYAGGVALNCIANTRALRESPFRRLHVPPFPNDSGLAAGMALYAYHQFLGVPRRQYLLGDGDGAEPMQPAHDALSPYLGPTHVEADVEAALLSVAADEGLTIEDAAPEDVGGLIAEGAVVAVWRGGSEAGPRALGHRSLLAPANGGFALRDRLNFKVKLREWYRPYAPIVLADRAGELFEEGALDSPYMTRGATIRPEWRDRLSAVCHVDGTTRPQTITRDREPFIYEVVHEVERRTGIPAVLNTSLNRKSPIVETPREAADLFRESAIDALVMDDWMIRRSR